MRYFDYGEDPEFDIEEVLEGSQQREKERLEEELEQIEHQLEERDRIFEENWSRNWTGVPRNHTSS
ncbi:hypothetical protein ACOZ4N_00475 (plasmid) [Halorientalis pallida]|uniref:hypothetical protein n=1 Tax=Halorientalis pallida TaxID=2479928 RepID=UPI003C6F1404